MLWIVAADAGDELGDRTLKLVEIHVRFDDVIDANVLRHENLHSLLLRIWPAQGYVRGTTTGQVESRFYNTKTVVKALVLGKLESETTSQRTRHGDHCALPDPAVLGLRHRPSAMPLTDQRKCTGTKSAIHPRDEFFRFTHPLRRPPGMWREPSTSLDPTPTGSGRSPQYGQCGSHRDGVGQPNMASKCRRCV